IQSSGRPYQMPIHCINWRSSIYIYADATNACGSIEERKAVDVTGGFFMLMPNPSDDYVEITTRSSIEGVNINSTQRNEPFETGTIRIFDSFGMIHTIVQLESKNQRISTSHLKDGVYVVEIKTKLRTERLNLLISRSLKTKFCY
ncbi:MAG TPA: T9SS type A sorting domain-containing protein, partial [Bacteroidales bacterium]|nr:T9SS type A sorting domain-containing protein [Bacteroidales bacterium]